ncbi:MAG: tetratricopeptide repeat protein [Trueperaceae bacterium]
MTARSPGDDAEPSIMDRTGDAHLESAPEQTSEQPPGQAAEQERELADWRELLEQRRFGAARRAFLAAKVLAAKAGAAGTFDGTGTGEARGSAGATGAVGAGLSDAMPGEDVDGAATRVALSALADVEELVRERSFAKAQERIRRLEEPAAIAPWDDLVADLERLRASAKALDQRNPDAAVATLEELGSTWFPAEVYTQLGTARIYDDRLEEARAHFEAALELDPQHYRALTNLGNVALEDGRVDDAIDAYERALKLNESFPNAHHNLGVAYRRKGQVHKSVRSLRTAQRAQQRQEAAEARESLGRIGAGSGAKIIRWVVYAVVAVALYLLLKNRGLF